jgi:lipopolysaccharide export system permease protein
MRLLDRYLLRELLMPFAYCLGGFLLLWISSDLFDSIGDFKEAGLSALDIAEYYVVKSPEFFAIVLPVALLLGLLYALTHHARHNEITAMRAAGVSLWRLARPYLGVGLLASIALFYVNEQFAPDAEHRAELVKARRAPGGEDRFHRHIVKHLGFVNERDQRNWLIGEFNSESLAMTSLVIRWKDADGIPVVFYASHASYTNDGWTFFNVREYRGDPAANAAPIPTLQEAVLPRPDFTETPEEIRSEVAISSRLTVKNRHRAELSLAELRNYLSLHPELNPAQASWLYTKMHSRIAGPWKCLVVVLIALPFGAVAGRRNIFAGVAGSIIICFAYFAVLEISLAIGTAGYLPAWLAGWFPNITFGLLGIWLTSRVR